MLRGARVVYIAAKSSSSIGYLLVPENGLKHFWAISLLNQYMYLMKFELCTFLSIMNTKVQRRRKAFPFPVGKTEAPSDGYPHDIRRFDIKGYACINLPISKAISGDYSIRRTDAWAAGFELHPFPLPFHFSDWLHWEQYPSAIDVWWWNMKRLPGVRRELNSYVSMYVHMKEYASDKSRILVTDLS